MSTAKPFSLRNFTASRSSQGRIHPSEAFLKLEESADSPGHAMPFLRTAQIPLQRVSATYMEEL